MCVCVSEHANKLFYSTVCVEYEKKRLFFKKNTRCSITAPQIYTKYFVFFLYTLSSLLLYFCCACNLTPSAAVAYKTVALATDLSVGLKSTCSFSAFKNSVHAFGCDSHFYILPPLVNLWEWGKRNRNVERHAFLCEKLWLALVEIHK